MTSSDPDNTLGGRLASAFVTLVFSIPLCAIYWFIANYQLAFVVDWHLSIKYFIGFVAGMALLGFAFPKAAPTVFGWLCDLLFASVRR